MKYITTVDDQQFEIEVVDEHHIRIGDRLLQVDFESVSGQPVFSLILDGRSYESFVYQGEEDWDVLLRGRQYQVKVEDEREKAAHAVAGHKQSGKRELRAAMPGIVVDIKVAEGSVVEEGQTLVVLEAMKMQNPLLAESAGKVTRLLCKKGEAVAGGALLLELE